MLENNKQCEARISAYGTDTGKTSGKPYFYIDFNVEGVGVRWFGSPIKKDGTINNLFAQQLAAAGFDTSRHKLADFSAGTGSNVLNESGTIKVRVVSTVKPNGEPGWNIGWIGESKTLSKEELTASLPANIDEMMKAVTPKAKRPLEDTIPF